MKRDLNFEAFYPFPPEKVWKAIANREALAQWLMPNDFEPRLGHKFRFRTQPRGGWSGIVECEVIELDEPRRLAYTWKNEHLDTVVTFTLDAVAGGTQLRLEHAGFAGLKPILVSFVFSNGWKSMLRTKLRRVIEGISS